MAGDDFKDWGDISNMADGSIQSYRMTREEAEEVRHVKRIFSEAGKIGAASAIGAYAIGGLIHYFGGPEYAPFANQVIANAHMAAIFGASGVLLSAVAPRP